MCVFLFQIKMLVVMVVPIEGLTPSSSTTAGSSTAQREPGKSLGLGGQGMLPPLWYGKGKTLSQRASTRPHTPESV